MKGYLESLLNARSKELKLRAVEPGRIISDLIAKSHTIVDDSLPQEKWSLFQSVETKIR
jgi:hypothetical protein